MRRASRLAVVGLAVALLASAMAPVQGRAREPSAGDRIASYLRLQAASQGLDVEPVDARPCPPLRQALRDHADRLGYPAPVVRPDLDPEIADATACLLDALLRADRLRDEAFADVDTDDLADHVGSDSRDPSAELAGLDRAKMFRAATVMAEALDRAVPVLREAGADGGAPVDLPPILYVDPAGRDDVHTKDYALMVELGGDDLYDNSAGGALVAAGSPLVPGPGVEGDEDSFQRDVRLPLGNRVVVGGDFEDADMILASSLVVDGAGDDDYGVKKAPRSDARCTDEQIVPRVAIQGAGVMTPAMLVDLGGANTLTAKTIAQGVGHVGGIGVLYLGDGPDTLEAVRSAQGSGVFAGDGLLVNAGGDDVYRVESPDGGVFNTDRGVCDDLPRYAQGSGFARSGGAALGVSGWLVDEGGDDVYVGVDKAQGHAETGAAGVLLDRAGRDLYRARNKSMGFGTGHTDTAGGGFGALVELGGADRYELSGTKGLGYGNGEVDGDVPPPERPLVPWLNTVVFDHVLALAPSAGALLFEETGGDVYDLDRIDRGDDRVETHGVAGVFADRE